LIVPHAATVCQAEIGGRVQIEQPTIATTRATANWFARFVRFAANPWMARRLTEMNAELDVRNALGAIRARCLVICRTDDVLLSPDNSRCLAAHIKGARGSPPKRLWCSASARVSPSLRAVARQSRDLAEAAQSRRGVVTAGGDRTRAGPDRQLAVDLCPAVVGEANLRRAERDRGMARGQRSRRTRAEVAALDRGGV
jgi:hypothetical protein